MEGSDQSSASKSKRRLDQLQDNGMYIILHDLYADSKEHYLQEPVQKKNQVGGWVSKQSDCTSTQFDQGTMQCSSATATGLQGYCDGFFEMHPLLRGAVCPKPPDSPWELRCGTVETWDNASQFNVQRRFRGLYLQDMLFLVETKQKDDYVRDVCVWLGYDEMQIVSPRGLSGGLVVCWEIMFQFKLFQLMQDLDLSIEYKSFNFYLSFIFGNPIPKLWYQLWEKLQRISVTRTVEI